MFNLLTDYEFDSVMHVLEHLCTLYMRDEAFTLSGLYAAHACCFQNVRNSAHARHTCAMNVYAMIRVCRTPIHVSCIIPQGSPPVSLLLKQCLNYDTCMPYMYHSVNTA